MVTAQNLGGEGLEYDLADVQRTLGRIEGEMIAHRGEQARLAGQFSAVAEENRKAREAIDNRMQEWSARFTSALEKMSARIEKIEHHQSEHDGSRHVIWKFIEWGVLGAIGIASAVAIWMADHTGMR